MADSDPTLEEAAEAVRAETLELLPLVRNAHSDMAAWDAERLVMMREVLLAHCRDGVVRLLEVNPVPENADLRWWRAVADDADSRIATFADPYETAKLWVSVGEDLAIQQFIIMRLSLVLAEEERRRRLALTAVGRIMQRVILFSELEAADHRELVERLRHRRWIGPGQKEDVEQEDLKAFLGFYRKLEEMALPLDTPAADLAPVALGLLRPHRPAPAGWEPVAGELLHEDIEASAEVWLPLLTPDLDSRSRQAAWDAWRERYRGSFAEERGGPGFYWECACEGLTHLWNVPRCGVCLQERPPKAPHVELLEEAHEDEQASPEDQAVVAAWIAAMKRRHGHLKVFGAFEALVTEARTTGHRRPHAEVAREHGVDESSLREFLDKHVRKDLS